MKERQINYRGDIKEELYKDGINLNARFIGPDVFVEVDLHP